MLKLVNIIKDYRMADSVVHAVKGVSLNFRKSEFVSILGPSGCGKTTLLNIIGGLDQYTDGDLIINDKSTKEFKSRDWDAYRNRSIGFIFQSYNLIPHLNVLQNVELALTISGVSRKKKRKLAVDALERVGLGGQLRKKPNQMSGGQMQRVAIARAIVNNPEIILADEPTGALDTKTSEQVMDLLQEIADDRLVIMVTHNPELAQRYSTRIIELTDGEVIADSNPYDGMPTVLSPVSALTDDDVTPLEEYIAKSGGEGADGSAPAETEPAENASAESVEDATATTEDAEKTTADGAPADGAHTENGDAYDEKFVAVVSPEKPVKVRKHSGKPKREKKERTSMSFFTALSLSARNLIAKRTRTFLTAFAGSIGIIGIALVLSLSNGFDLYMNELEGSILSSMPLTVNSMAIDIDVDELMNMEIQTGGSGDPFPDSDFVTPYEPDGLISGITFGANVLTKEYIRAISNYAEEHSDLFNAIQYDYSYNMPILVKSASGRVSQVSTTLLSNPLGWQELLWDEFMLDQFDVLAGGYPGTATANATVAEHEGAAYDSYSADEVKARQAVLVISSYNTIDYEILTTLGMQLERDENGDYLPVDFDDIIGREIVIASNDNYYNTANAGYTADTNGDGVKNEDDQFQTVTVNTDYASYYDSGDNVKVYIVGVLRMQSDILAPLLQNGVAYTQELTGLCLKNAETSSVVTLQKQYNDIDVLTGEAFDLDFSALTSSLGVSDNALLGLILPYLTGEEKIPGVDIDFSAILGDDVMAALAECATVNELFDVLTDWLLTSDSTGARMLKTVIANHFDISPDELDKFAVVEYMLEILVDMMNDMLGTSLSADSIMTLLNSGYETALQELGGADDEGFHMPTGIYIYPTTFDTKDTICAFLDSWNDANPSAAVTYTDYAGTISTLLSMVVDIVSYILIAFAAISLVVSSVMIAIITYVSVLERTTEIGVLRSIGARKLDISNLFNAETAIIGATAGVLGVFIAWILDFPINYWISTLATQAPSDFAVLNPLHALLLVALSIFLTVLSGLIPAIAAAKKDPVKALRASG